ncbi:MAG: CRISPR-associated endonuclease Cas2 [Rhodothermales bacterium]
MTTHAHARKRYDLLVAYDVNTATKAGERRLRRVAKICEGFGQRVQYSIFECRVSEAQLEEMEHRLLEAMNKDKDSIRIYRFRGGRDGILRVYGQDRYQDFDDPLII